MQVYTNFAKVYDTFMNNVPYEEWCEQTVNILKSKGINEGIVAELGCGTGTLTELLAAAGYDMIGIDNSADMLDIAMDKKFESGSNILYLYQDMREFELYGTCSAIISRCDSINYILEYKDLVQVFKLVNNYLDPKAPFIFDCNTLYKYENILKDNTIAENLEAASFIWENSFDKSKRINEYALTLYIKEEKDIYKRYEERHVQKAYTLEEIKSAISESGLILETISDADTLKDINENTQRYLITARENGK